MAKVTLYDQARDKTIELENSSTITVGRGFFECQDKRVSRKHGEITVLETKVIVRACHANPIFYKVNGSAQNQILNKDSEIELKNSDKFSLLPNSEYEYEVKVVRNEEGLESSENFPAATSSASVMRVRNVLEINDNLEAGNMATSLSQIDESSTNLADTTNNEDLDRTPSPDMLVAPSDFVQASPSSSRKRSFEGDADSNVESSKRLKSSDTTVSCSTSNPKPTGSDDTPNIFIKPDPDSTAATSTSTVTTSSSTSTTAPKIKPDPDSSPSTTTGTSVTASVKSEVASNLRPSCEFGIRCYRNTADHLRDMAHPADSDYRRPSFPSASADAPSCPWGSACYRRNPEHFRMLQHPPSSNVYSTQPSAIQPVSIPPLRPANVLVDRDEEIYEQEGESFDDSEADMDYNADDQELSEPDNDEDEENNLEE